MSNTVTVGFWDMDLQESIYTLEMIAVPRIGETVYFGETVYKVRDVYWYFDIEKDDVLQDVVVSVETKSDKE
jgi:hypothetical protein